MYKIFFKLHYTNGAGAKLNVQEEIFVDNSCRLLELEETVRDYGKRMCKEKGWKFTRVDSVNIPLKNGG